MEDLREAQLVLKEAQWADDKEVSKCKQCNKPFSVSRRKVPALYLLFDETNFGVKVLALYLMFSKINLGVKVPALY